MRKPLISVAIAATGAALAIPAAAAKPLPAPTAYVTNWGSNTVAAISVATDTVVATIPVGTTPDAVAATPNHVFIDNLGSDNVSVIDPFTNTVTRTIPVASTVGYGSIAAHGNKVYVVSNHNVSVYNGNTGKLVKSATLPTAVYYPSGAALNAAGTQLWALDRYGDTDSSTANEIDTTSLKVTASVPLGYEYDALTISLNSTRAYVIGDGGYMYTIDEKTAKVLSTSPYLGVDPAGVAASNEYVYGVNRVPGQITEVNAVTGATLTSWSGSPGEESIGAALTPDNSQLFVTTSGGNVDIYNVPTGTLRATVSAGPPIGQSTGDEQFITP